MSCLICMFFIIVLSWKVIFPVLRILLAYTLGITIFSKRRSLRKAGEWAIVTGSTDGIGKAYAHELARDGLNIMLVSRSSEKLAAVAKEIEDAHGVKTKTVQCDFTRTDIYTRLEDEVNQLTSIACLVNNVGVSYPFFDAYDKADFLTLEFIQNLLACNVHSTACLTRIVLPKLVKQNSPVGPAIINLSSFSGLTPFPYLSLYGASKAFVLHLSESLRLELHNTNVTIQAVCPMLVATAMSQVKRTGFFIPSPEKFASSALTMLGVENVTSGCLGHALQSWAITVVPGVVARTAENMYRKAIRRIKRE